MIKTFTYLLAALFFLSACTSGKKAMQQGNYDEAIYKAVNRLRSNSDHKKSLEILRLTYPLAQRYHLDRVRNMEMSYEQFKWEPIVREYGALNNIYDELTRCPGCMTAVPNPVNYTAEYERTRLKAASDRYDAGLAALEKAKAGDRAQAKMAFDHFFRANEWAGNYKEVTEKLKEAEYYATISVVVEPIPMHSQALKISNEFFDNKINEFLLNAPINRFVRFYTVKEAKRLGINKPDQIIQLNFDDFVVGQTYLHEKEAALIRDSIVLATYDVALPATGSEGTVTICHKTATGTQTMSVSENSLKAHLDHGDKIGSCETGTSRPSTGRKETRKVYGQAKATMHTFTKTLESKGLLDLRILDGHTRRVLSQEKLPGVFVWQSQWGYYNGDERALEKDHLRIIKNKEVPPPAPQDLFIAFTQPIYDQLTAKIRQFYQNY